jgi:hypothetical protein
MNRCVVRRLLAALPIGFQTVSRYRVQLKRKLCFLAGGLTGRSWALK